MRPLPLALPLSALALLLLAPPALARPQHHHAQGAATRVELGLGGDYIVDPELGALQLTLGFQRQLARGLSAGLRAGGLVTGEPTRFGAPIDARLRVRTHGLYFEGLVGPWLLFDSGDTLRLHGAFGFGLSSGGVSFGLEVGALGRSGIGGLRLAFAL
jgi:hypothetical protein